MSSTDAAVNRAFDSCSVTNEPTDLEQAFAQCATSLYRYFAVRVGYDRHQADDLMQQLWIQAMKSAAGVPLHEIEFWLKAVAKNLVRAHWRKLKSARRHVPMVDPATASELAQRIANEDLPDEYWQRRDVMDQLVLAVTDLSSDEQELIVAHYFHGESLGSLATRWGKSERAIEGRLYRARRALRQKLESPGV